VKSHNKLNIPSILAIRSRGGSRFSGNQDGVPDEANITVKSRITSENAGADGVAGCGDPTEVSCPAR
jgi:hypothetical protein